MVPSDSPDDYTVLNDMKSKPAFRVKSGVKDERVLPFEVLPIIEVPPFGNKFTETVWLQMKIKSQNEKDKLAEAKKQTYLKVQEAKPLLGASFWRQVSILPHKLSFTLLV